MAERDEKDAIAGTNTPEQQSAPEAPSPATSGGGASSSPPPAISPAASVSPVITPTPAPPTATPASAAPAEPPAETPAPEPGLQTDIAQILASAPLPERRGTGKSAAAPNQKTYDTSLTASTPEREPERRVPLPEAPAHKDALATVHTLKHDLQDVVREQKISRVRAAAIESEKRRPEVIDEALPQKRGIPKGMIVSLIALFVIGIGALAGVYYFALAGAPQTLVQSRDSLVFAEASRTLSLDGKSPSTIKQELAQIRSEKSSVLGAITRIVPSFGTSAPVGQKSTERLATTREFLTAIGAQAPEELLRALSDTFFLGTHMVDKNAPFIVIPVLSYDRAFAGMLAWEDTINMDLAPFFTPLAPLTLGPGGTVVTRTFSDDVNRNYDVRVLKDDSGTIQLYYSFPTRGMLVIAESPYTLSEAVTRLQAARRL